MIVQVGFETSDRVVFGDLDYGAVHSGLRLGYASDGGTCFLKVSWAELGESSDGYIYYLIIKANPTISTLLPTFQNSNH